MWTPKTAVNTNDDWIHRVFWDKTFQNHGENVRSMLNSLIRDPFSRLTFRKYGKFTRIFWNIDLYESTFTSFANLVMHGLNAYNKII